MAAGPDDWRRVDEVEDRLSRTVPYPPAQNAVSDVVVEDNQISFTTSAIGVPHLVKVSYFPNWTADGAEGPYRATPSLMVVVPTSNEVVLEFRNTWAENLGMVISVVTLVGLGIFAALRFRRSRTGAGTTYQASRTTNRAS